MSICGNVMPCGPGAEIDTRPRQVLVYTASQGLSYPMRVDGRFLDGAPSSPAYYVRFGNHLMPNAVLEVPCGVPAIPDAYS